jgi:hypothetical protein
MCKEILGERYFFLIIKNTMFLVYWKKHLIWHPKIN